ncbi:MAG: TonB-dependent receptor [Acidobacteriota bacterium]
MRWMAILAATLALAGPSEAQTPLALVLGEVRDASAAPVAAAQVTVTRVQTGQALRTSSDQAGRFVLPAIPAGDYQLDVERDGFKKYSLRLRLQVGQQLRTDVRLTLGAIAESVDVSAPAVSAERLRSSGAMLIEGHQVVDLPLDGRHVLELSLLAPGVEPAAPGSAGSVRGDFALHVSGGREDSNGFLLDGVLNVDPKLNTLGVAPPADAVQEFEIVTSTPDASFGRNAAGQINLISKSGANQIAGTAYEFLRHQSLDATNAFAPRSEPPPEYRRHQFGASIGGPIVANRSFFFADYEGTRTREGITRITNVPTMAERSGDFSQTLFARPIDPYTQQPFPGGSIPAYRLSSVGAAIAALYPAPNRAVPFQNYVSSPVGTDRRDQADVRIDHTESERAALTFRASVSDRELFEPFSGAGFAAIPGFGDRVPRRAWNLMASERRTVSPRLFNEARVGFTHIRSGVFQENASSLNRQVGLPEASTDSRDWGLSLVTITGLSPIGHEYNNPQSSTTRQVQIGDTLTWTGGGHLVKAGAEWRTVAQDGYRDVQSRGFLAFSSQVPITTNALADLLLGYPVTTGVAHLDNPQRLRTFSYGAFVQDNIRLGPRLSVSAGLRYEFNSPAVDAGDRAYVYDTATRSLVRVGTAGVPRGGYVSDRNNWAPRAGMAWDVDGQGATVVRAGAGIYYDQAALAPSEGLYFNPPYFDLRLYFPLPGLPLTLADPFPAQFPYPVPPSATTYQRDFQTARVTQWNISVQRQLGRSRLLDMAYVGGEGRNLLRGRDINQAAPSPASYNPRPDPRFADITLLESAAHSTYKSLQCSFTQRLSGGVSAVAAYTWSSAYDDASGLFSSSGDPNFPQDSRSPQAEWGRSNFDLRHRLSVGFTYALPMGAGGGHASNASWPAALLANWQITGILTVQSGRPFTVALLPEFDNSNTGRASLGFGANDRPNLVGNPTLTTPSATQWFNTSAFAIPAYGSFGNAGRNILEGPGYANLNVALLKLVRLTAGARLQLRLEAFNLINRTNYNLPDNFLGSPTVGQIQSAGSPRRLQLGAKLLF